MKCSCEQISLAPFLTGKTLGISNRVSEQRNRWKNGDDWRRGARPRLWEGDGRCRQGTGAGQTCGKGQSLFFFVAIRVFLQALQSQFWASLCGFLSRPLLSHPRCLLAGFQPAWPRLAVVRVNVQHQHLGARDEICAQKEIINK